MNFDDEAEYVVDFADEDAQLAVKHGAYWLDENHPDWVERIDLSELHMSDCDQCVIGQAVGDYFDTIETASLAEGYHWGGANHWAGAQGFQPPRNVIETERYYRRLEELWTDEIRKRLG